MNWIRYRIKVLFEPRLTKKELSLIDKRVLSAIGDLDLSTKPVQLSLIRRTIEVLETR